MSKVITVKEMKDAAKLFKNFDITKSLNFYGSLVTNYKAVVDEYFNSSSFNLKEPEKGTQPNLMKNFLNLAGNAILEVLNSYNETDEVNISEVIQSALDNDHKFNEAIAKIVSIHVGRNIPAHLYPPVAEKLILNIGNGNELVKEILNEVGTYFVKTEEKQYNELKEYKIENFEEHKIKIEMKNADGDTAKIKFYRQNEQEVTPHKHGQIITIKVGSKYSEFTVMKTGHDEEGHYYECLIKKNPNGTVTNYLFNDKNQLVKAQPSYIESDIETTKDLVLISGGSGESHSISIINEIINKKDIPFPQSIHVIHSTKSENSDTFQLDEVINVAKSHNINVSHHKHYTHCSGRMTKESLSDILENHDSHYEVCTSSSFSTAIQQTLKGWGVEDVNIHIEGFGSIPETLDSALIGVCPFH